MCYIIFSIFLFSSLPSLADESRSPQHSSAKSEARSKRSGDEISPIKAKDLKYYFCRSSSTNRNYYATTTLTPGRNREGKLDGTYTVSAVSWNSQKGHLPKIRTEVKPRTRGSGNGNGTILLSLKEGKGDIFIQEFEDDVTLSISTLPSGIVQLRFTPSLGGGPQECEVFELSKADLKGLPTN